MDSAQYNNFSELQRWEESHYISFLLVGSQPQVLAALKEKDSTKVTARESEGSEIKM